MITKIKNSIKSYSYRKKLIISNIAIVVIPLIFLVTISYNYSLKFLKEEKLLILESQLHTIITEVNDKIENFEEFTKFLTYNPSLKKILFENNETEYSNLIQMNDDIERIIWYQVTSFIEIKNITFYINKLEKPLGRFIHSSEEVENEEWFKSILNHTKVETFFYDDEIIIAQTITNKSNSKKAGVACIRIDLNSLMRKIMLDTSFQSSFLIANSNNNILYSINNKIDDILNDKQYIEILDSNTNNIKIESNKFAISKKNFHDYKFVSYFNEKNFASSYKKILSINLVIIVICLFIVGLIINFSSKKMSKRLDKLFKKIELVSLGDTKIKIQSDYGDEIGFIENKIGDMVTHIDELIVEVYENKLFNKELNLKLLQAQINPHFLYNTLSIINWKAKDSNTEDISLIVKNLSKFYRTVLNNGKYTTRIKSEIENIKSYIDIQLMMHDNSFKFFCNVSEDSKELDIVNFILQPIVENAIIHGVDEADEEGILKVDVFKKDDFLILEIFDNGPGISDEKKKHIFEDNQSGYGLRNIRERLKLYYDNFNISIISDGIKNTVIQIKIKIS